MVPEAHEISYLTTRRHSAHHEFLVLLRILTPFLAVQRAFHIVCVGNTLPGNGGRFFVVNTGPFQRCTPLVPFVIVVNMGRLSEII